MAEITRRRKGELIRGLFEALHKNPEGLQARDALRAVEKLVPPTAFEEGTYKNGARRYGKIIRFATIVFVKAGWLVKSKGKWSVTEEGWQAYGSVTDPDVFYGEARKRYLIWRANQPDAQEPEADEIEEGGSRGAAITFEEAEEQSWTEIEAFLTSMPPYEFQELVASLLRAMGYFVSWIAPPGKDGGIDILAWTDPLGTKPPRIKVQVKRQMQTIGVEGLRSFMAVLGDDDVGLFVSIGGFTKDAADEARTQEKRKVTLIDLENLFNLWVEHYVRLSDEARRRFPLKPIYFLSPEP